MHRHFRKGLSNIGALLGYANLGLSFLSQDEVERAKIFSLAWKYVDTLLLTILENRLKKLAEEKLMIERLKKRMLNSK
jgi:hypothetical protein